MPQTNKDYLILNIDLRMPIKILNSWCFLFNLGVYGWSCIFIPLQGCREDNYSDDTTRLPDKPVRMITSTHNGYKCSVICINKLSSEFEVTIGVRQGCMLSPLLCLVVLDWVLWKTTEQRRNGYLGEPIWTTRWTLLCNMTSAWCYPLEKHTGESKLALQEYPSIGTILCAEGWCWLCSLLGAHFVTVSWN